MIENKSNMIKCYFQPAFLICAAVLAITGAGMSIAIESLGIYLKKEPIQLRKPLDFLDENGLSHFSVGPQNKLKIENPEIVKELGTEDYIQWIIVDGNVPANSPVRKCFLFITYYPSPDKVPHIPEECYTGGGFQKILSSDVVLHIGNSDTSKISAQYLVFGNDDTNILLNQGKFPVLYFFRVNGEYAGSREEARMALNKNLFRKSSYFSKVEIAFNQSIPAPGKEETIKATESLLNVILPILEKEYWPEW
ncbi:MAG: hypothetical protein JXA96_04215 [Sedimentisphaerales bacterium]|nr:hypothetical protein [Sedimentisphaerales bacterium]